MLQAELKVVGGKQNNQVVSLPPGKFLIGREQDCHLRPNSELVSRHHCVFTADEFGLRVRDLGSTNGTFVNDERIEKQVVLKQGDQVVVGSLNFEVQLQEVAVPVGAVDAAAGVGEVPPTPEPVSDPAMEATEAGSETVFDMQIPPEAENAGETVQLGAGDDTTMLPAQPQPPQPPMPGYPPQQHMPYAPPPIQYPPGYGQYQPQPMYPPQYPGYPQPPMPGYPPMPAQQMPPMQYPAAPAQPAAAPPEEGAAGGEEVPEVTLPSPGETGVKEEADKKGSGGSSKSDDNPSGSAGDIIKQYIQRRPKSS